MEAEDAHGYWCSYYSRAVASVVRPFLSFFLFFTPAGLQNRCTIQKYSQIRKVVLEK